MSDHQIPHGLSGYFVTDVPAWSVTFPAMPADSDSARMVINGETAPLTLGNILLGDVWLLGGQSNMEQSARRPSTTSL